MTGIYKITINDYYIYIGQSMDIEGRWKQHLSELKQNKHYNKKLQNVYNKHSDNIKFEIIERCDINKLDEREMFYIEQFNAYNTKHGLNMSIGGDCGWRKYRTKEEAEAAALEKCKQWYENNKEYFKQYCIQYCKTHERKFKQYHNQYNKQYYNTHIQEIKEHNKQYYYDNKEYCKQYFKQYYLDNIERNKEYHKERRRKRGILSKKEKFEKRYSLSRSLTDEEWHIWRTDKSVSGNKDKPYAIKYLKTLPNLTFVVP